MVPLRQDQVEAVKASGAARWPSWLIRGVLGSAYAVFAVATISSMQSGLHGDPRRTNPNPGAAPYPPFLGFDNWPLVIALMSIPLAIGLAATLLWLSIRQRRVHWAVVIAFVGLLTGALDPLANWATTAFVADDRESLDEAVSHIRSGRPLPLHPLCGGLPPDIAWPYLERAAAAEAMAAS